MPQIKENSRGIIMVLIERIFSWGLGLTRKRQNLRRSLLQLWPTTYLRRLRLLWLSSDTPASSYQRPVLVLTFTLVFEWDHWYIAQLELDTGLTGTFNGNQSSTIASFLLIFKVIFVSVISVSRIYFSIIYSVVSYSECVHWWCIGRWVQRVTKTTEVLTYWSEI